VRTRQHGNGLTVVVATEAPPLEGDSLYTTMCVISRYRGAMGIGSVLHHFHVYWRHIDVRACRGIERSSLARLAGAKAGHIDIGACRGIERCRGCPVHRAPIRRRRHIDVRACRGISMSNTSRVTSSTARRRPLRPPRAGRRSISPISNVSTPRSAPRSHP